MFPGECDFTQFGAGDGMISILSGPGQQLHEGGDQSEGAAVPGMEQFFTPDGQFSDDIMQQLQSGQQVHIDFTSNTVTATDPASANETEQGELWFLTNRWYLSGDLELWSFRKLEFF